MAGEVKYDTLPFIDVSGKDIFECGSEIQNAIDNENVELQSEAVDHINLDTTKAFNVFQNKYLDSSNADFSDRILLSNKRGYQAKTVYEIIGEQVAKETPQQKYQRLQLELKELAEEIEQIKESASSESKEVNPVSLSQQVSDLHTQLRELHLEKVLGPEIVGNDGIQPGTWTREFKNQLLAFKSHPAASKADAEESFLYQVQCKPEHTKFAVGAKIHELESKVNEIESFIGTDKQKLKTIIPDCSENTNLMDITSSIQAKLSLFDISHIDIIAARLQGLLHCINEISQKKDTMEHAETQTKVNELHQLITSWDSVATVVPDLIERLKSLNSLNEQAATYTQSLDYLTSSQDKVQTELSLQKDILEKFEKTFADNIDIIQTNCCTLETRISDLMRKVNS